jgi:hypothetical protein
MDDRLPNIPATAGLRQSKRCRVAIVHHDQTGLIWRLAWPPEGPFLVIDAGLKIGVDPIAPSGEVAAALGPDIRYYQTASDDFFAEQAENLDAPGLDFAFIDGLHTYDQSLRDVENCLRYPDKCGAWLRRMLA